MWDVKTILTVQQDIFVKTTATVPVKRDVLIDLYHSNYQN